MGFSLKNRYVYWVTIIITIINFSISPSYCCCYDSKSLSVFFRDQANQSISKPQTGLLYNVSLPSNFTGMEVTFVRLRSGSFRNRGANSTSVYIPPNVVPIPFVKRLAIVYENLGNWSSLYYHVPNYSLVAPVIGFTVYDSPNVVGDARIDFSVRGNPISIRFDNVVLRGKNDTAPKCVRFDDDGGFEIKNMTYSYVCDTTSQGRFSIVVPYESVLVKRNKRYLKWWLIGFGGGFVAIVLLVLAVIMIFKVVKRRRLVAMERQSENGVSFATFWVGTSKMPSASMIRTQPAIEHSFAM